ncbi:MAG: acyltransferase, partial [Pseudomonadota bacterium]
LALVTHEIHVAHLWGLERRFDYEAFVGPVHSHAAVVVFFVLSGYLIAYSVENSIFRKPEYRFYDYFLDRWTRIYSVLLPALAMTILFDVIGKSVSPLYYNDPSNVGQDHYPLRLMLNALCLQGAHGFRASFGSNGALWSISYEWAFYLWYGMVRLLAFRSRHPLALTFLFSGALVLVYGFPVSSYLLVWLMGVAAYFFQLRCGATIPFPLACIVLLFSHWLVNMASVGLSGFSRDVFFAAFVANVLAFRAVSGVRPDGGLDRLSKYFADFSFSLYAYHMPIQVLLLTIAAIYAPKVRFPLISLCVALATLLATRLFYSVTEANRGLLRRWIEKAIPR